MLEKGSQGIARALIVGAGLLALPEGTPAQIIAPAARTLFNRAVMVRSFVRFDRFDRDEGGVGGSRIVNVYALVWGAYPNWSLTAVVPLLHIERHAARTPGRETSTTSLGDGGLFARYDLLRANAPSGLTRLSPEVGIKVPTGGALGSGSTDFSAGLIFSHVRDPHWWIADAQFTYTTSGDDGARQGNHWTYDLAYLSRLLPRGGMGAPALYLVLELNGEHARRSRRGGIPLADSGGNLLFLSPGIELILSRRAVLELSAPLPIWRDLTGGQLEPSWSTLAGFRWLL